MKITSTVRKLLFFKTTDSMYLGHKDLKKHFKLTGELQKNGHEDGLSYNFNQLRVNL